MQKNEKFMIKNMVRTSEPKNQEFHKPNEPQPKIRCSYKKNVQSINRLHERALRIVYNDFQSTFDDLPIRDKSFSINTSSKHSNSSHRDI